MLVVNKLNSNNFNTQKTANNLAVNFGSNNDGGIVRFFTKFLSKTNVSGISKGENPKINKLDFIA